MRSILMGVFCALLAIALGGCSSTSQDDFADIEVDVSSNPAFDLSQYGTYAWAAAAAAVRDPDGEWTPPGLDLGSEITFLADRELRNRGRTAVVDAPDMLAIYAVGVDMKALDVKRDPEHRIVTSEVDPRAGVMVVLVDSKTRRAMWISRAVADVSESPSVELVKRRLDHAMTRMFSKFPEYEAK